MKQNDVDLLIPSTYYNAYHNGAADQVSKSLIDTIIDARKDSTTWKKKSSLIMLINNLGATPGISCNNMYVCIGNNYISNGIYICMYVCMYVISGIEIYSVAKSSVKYLQSLGYSVSRAYVGKCFYLLTCVYTCMCSNAKKDNFETKLKRTSI